MSYSFYRYIPILLDYSPELKQNLGHVYWTIKFPEQPVHDLGGEAVAVRRHTVLPAGGREDGAH